MEKRGDSDVEDGEIVDYNPLPRPITRLSRPSDSGLKYSDDSDESETENSDSDSDSDSTRFRTKRPKLKERHKYKRNIKEIKSNSKKYNIWSSELQETTLTDELVSCDVRNKKLDCSRDVESYDYRLAYQLHKQNEEIDGDQKYETLGRKRRFEERVSVKQRLGQRPSSDSSQNKGSSRFLLDLKVTIEDSAEDVARDIAIKLCEQKEELILRVVEVLGKQKAMDIFLETKRIEEDGGMLIMNGSRRRTPGGVYLLLIKRDDNITHETQQQIFIDDQRAADRERKVSSALLRKQKSQEFKRSLSVDITLSERDLPALLTRAELTVQQIAEGNREKRGEADGEASVTNPPPSPATDGGEQLVEDRHPASYEDDFLDIACDNMDLF